MMAEKKQQQEPEITSEESNNPIDEDELELSLGIRPIHSHSHSRSSRTFQKLPAAAAPVFNNFLLSKRDAQAFRRQEAKKKRDLKRQASNIKREENEEDVVKRCRNDDSKLNASYWGPPSWWSWTPAGAGFRPYQGHNGKILTEEQNGEIIQQSLSTGSSSDVSDNYQNTSCPGGNNSDAGSHSSHPQSQLLPSNDPTAIVLQTKPGSSQAQPQPNCSSPNLSLPQLCSSSSNQIESTTTSLRQSSNSPEGATSSNAISNQGKVTTSPSRSPSPKEAKREMGKPPKPNGQMNQERLAVSQMPCVSTTGNGPNGKTITGFLYRYTKAEVSIVCVCHGASFSPAGFVEHAGGVDIEHPLRHIRVVPFAL